MKLWIVAVLCFLLVVNVDAKSRSSRSRSSRSSSSRSTSDTPPIELERDAAGQLARTLSVSPSLDSITFRSDIRDAQATSGDRMYFRCDVSVGRFRCRMTRHANRDDEATAFSFAIRLGALVEYVDAGNDGWTSESFLQTIMLNQWGEMSYTAGSGDNWHTMTVSTLDGLLTVAVSVAQITRSDTGDGAVTVKPTGAKIDITIANFPFVANNSVVALIAKVDARDLASKQAVSDAFQGPSVTELVSVSGGGMFSWVDFYKDNTNVQHSVLASALAASPDSDDTTFAAAGESSKRMIFTFNASNGATNILWDPVIAGPDGEGNGVSALVPAFAAVVAVLLLAL